MNTRHALDGYNFLTKRNRSIIRANLYDSLSLSASSHWWLGTTCNHTNYASLNALKFPKDPHVQVKSSKSCFREFWWKLLHVCGLMMVKREVCDVTGWWTFKNYPCSAYTFFFIRNTTSPRWRMRPAISYNVDCGKLHTNRLTRSCCKIFYTSIHPTFVHCFSWQITWSSARCTWLIVLQSSYLYGWWTSCCARYVFHIVTHG